MGRQDLADSIGRPCQPEAIVGVTRGASSPPDGAHVAADADAAAGIAQGTPRRWREQSWSSAAPKSIALAQRAIIVLTEVDMAGGDAFSHARSAVVCRTRSRRKLPAKGRCAIVIRTFEPRPGPPKRPPTVTTLQPPPIFPAIYAIAWPYRFTAAGDAQMCPGTSRTRAART